MSFASKTTVLIPAARKRSSDLSVFSLAIAHRCKTAPALDDRSFAILVKAGMRGEMLCGM